MKKKIVIGSIFAVLLMLMMPNISSVNMNLSKQKLDDIDINNISIENKYNKNSGCALMYTMFVGFAGRALQMTDAMIKSWDVSTIEDKLYQLSEAGFAGILAVILWKMAIRPFCLKKIGDLSTSARLSDLKDCSICANS